MKTLKTNGYNPQPADVNASSYTFGIEFEVTVPTSAQVARGGYHSGIRIESAINLEGERIEAPRFNGKCLRGDYDGSIVTSSGSQMGVEVVSPILRGQAGLDFIKATCEFLNAIGAKVNRTCGLHVTFGVDSVIGFASQEDRLKFARKFVHLARNNVYGVYGQSGTDRHTNHYCTPLTARADDVAKDSLRNLGRGMVNFGNFQSGRIEVRAFAGTTNVNKVMHHLATVLGLASRAKAQKQITVFNGRSNRGRKVDTAILGLWKMHRNLGWRQLKDRDIAHGLFGTLHSELKTWLPAAVEMAKKWDTRFPETSL